MQTSLHHALALGLAGLSGQAIAQEPSAGTHTHHGDSLFTLGVVEVTGRPDSTLPREGERITREELALWQRHDLSQALDLIPAVTIQNVGQRRERLISVRGFNSRQVPLFIDGVPVYVPYDGNVDLSRFGLDYVSEVQVSGGLASVLYGFNALGGAVNVVSRKPAEPLETLLSLGVEHGESSRSLVWRSSAHIGSLKERFYYQLSASASDAQGYALADDFRAVPAQGSGARENAASDDRLVHAKFGWTGERSEYAISLHDQRGEKHVPPYAGSAAGVSARFWRWPFWDKQGAYFTARTDLNDRATLRWRVYRDAFTNSLDSYDDAGYDSFNRPYAFQGSVYDDYTWGGNADIERRWSETHVSRVALHLKHDVHREVDDIAAPQERYEDRSHAIALEHQWRLGETLHLTPGYSWSKQQGRRAENNAGGVLVPFEMGSAEAHGGQLVLVRDAPAGWQWTAGASRKTRFPTIKDRFSYRMGAAIPNPALGPETASHLEAGVRGETGKVAWTFTVFHASLDDAIENVVVDRSLCTAPNPNCFQQRNVGEQRNRGVETSLRFRPIEGLEVLAQASLLDRDNRSSPQILSTDTPDSKLRLGLHWQVSAHWALNGEIQHESKRYTTSDGARIAPGFNVANAFLSYSPSPRWQLTAGIRNIGDELYAYSEGFFEPGRTGLLRVDFRY